MRLERFFVTQAHGWLVTSESVYKKCGSDENNRKFCEKFRRTCENCTYIKCLIKDARKSAEIGTVLKKQPINKLIYKIN